MRLGRVGAMAHKELLHIRRDPLVLALALAVPVVLIVLFGHAISFDLDRLPIALVDDDRSQASRILRRELLASGELVARVEGDLAAADAALRRGDVVGALIIPAGFGARSTDRDLQLLVDGSDGTIANNLIGKVDAIAVRLLPRAGAAPPAKLAVLNAFNPASISAWFIVPGLAAYVVALIAVLLTALTIAREFERGSMEQLFATPVTPFEIVVGKLLPYLGLGALAVLLVLVVGAVGFDVPQRGDPIALVVASGLFLAGMLGQGLLISTIAPNQMVATQVAVMSSMLPSMLLSGFVFPIQNMPAALQAVTLVIPARYYVEVLRGVLLRGNGLPDIGSQCLALAIFAVVVLGAAVRRFRREAT